MSHTNLPGRWVGHCNCGTWDHLHENGCGWDVNDAPTAAGPIAAKPYAAVPNAPAKPEHPRPLAPGHDMTYPDLIVLTEWMAHDGFGADDIAEAVRKPWKWEAELESAQEWMAEQMAKLARSAS